jgi:hypothetical protein
MDLDTIFKLTDARPFKPFNLILDDGRKLPVDRPSYIAVSPDRKRMAHASVDGGFEHLDPLRVVGVDFDVDNKVLMASQFTGTGAKSA